MLIVLRKYPRILIPITLSWCRTMSSKKIDKNVMSSGRKLQNTLMCQLH